MTSRLNLRFGPLLAGLVLLACALPAAAGSLYKCVGKNGEIAYSSSRAGFRECKVAASYQAEPAPAKAAPGAAPATTSAAAAAAAPAGKRVDFRTGSADVPPAAAGGSGRVVRGAVYKFERNGVVHYTNVRPADAKAEVLFTYVETCYACGALPGVDFHNVRLNTEAFAAEIAAATAKHGVDAALVRAVIHAESAFRPNAKSHKGAQGLMQLIPATAARFGVDDAFVPAQNIDGGVSYLAWLLQRFEGDELLATAAYNAGEGAVGRHGGIPPYEETQRYVERVAILRERYREAGQHLAATGGASGDVVASP